MRACGIGLALLTAVSLGIAAGCGGGGGKGADVVATTRAATDGNGVAAFATQSASGQIRVIDKNGIPIRDVSVAVVSRTDEAVAEIVDPSGQYIPRFAVIPTESRASRLAWSQTKEFILVQWSDWKNGGTQLVYDDRLPAGVTREWLQKNWQYRRTTELHKLGFEWKDIFERVVDEAADELADAAVTTVLTAIPYAGVALGPGYAATSTVADATALGVEISNLPFVANYRAQGYVDNQKFEIWTLKVLPRSSLVSPILILPLEKPRNPSPQTTRAKIRAELTWDTAGTDVDLHLLQPGGELFNSVSDCYFGNMSPDWGVPGVTSDNPVLDVDDTDGYGPENIILETAQQGTYRLYLHYYNDHSNGDTPVPTQAWVRVWFNDQANPVTYGPFRLTRDGRENGDLFLIALVDVPGGTVRSVAPTRAAHTGMFVPEKHKKR